MLARSDHVEIVKLTLPPDMPQEIAEVLAKNMLPDIVEPTD